MNKLHFLHQVIHLINDLFFPRNFSRSAASQFGHNEGKRTLGIICACSDDFDWEGVKKPNIPQSELIIYEMHVRQFKNTQTPMFLKATMVRMQVLLIKLIT